MDGKDIKIVFEPGCFDSFDGTQEELDALVAEIRYMLESGEAFENAETIQLDDLPDSTIEMLMSDLTELGQDRKRKLN